MTNSKNFNDLLGILSSQMDIVTKKQVSQEDRKNAQTVSNIVANYVSLSVHKFEYEMNKKDGMPEIPAFESGNAKAKR